MGKELWKDIKGYEGLYQISNTGKVLSIARKTTNGGLMALTFDKDGYLCVDLYKDNKRKNCKVHRLVAEAFLEKDSGKNIVNHKDENKANNNADNLEWCDVQYNNTYNMRQKKINSRKRKPVRSIADDGTITCYESITKASEVMNISRRSIQYCLSGKCQTVAGYRWEKMQNG